MQDIVTRCPECRIAFRATQIQLQAANGLVRCGACLHVFNGRDHKLSDPSPKIGSAAPAEERPEEPLIDDQMIAALMGAQNPLLEQEITPGEEPTESAGADGGEETEKQQTDDVTAGDSLTFRQQVEEETHSQEVQLDDNREAPPGMVTDAESGAEAPPASAAIGLLMPAKPAPEPEPDTGDADAAAETGSQESLPEFLRQPPARARRAQWHWVLLSLLGTVALAAQYVHFRADILGLHPDYRQLTDNICRMTGCELPQQIAVDRIQTGNLVVQSHPDYKNALQLDAVLVNRAPFEQPFPGLLLQFSDLGGNTVAVRRFAPEEYLMGELQGAVIMTRNQPIRLSLNLIDPGAAAVNFSLSAVE